MKTRLLGAGGIMRQDTRPRLLNLLTVTDPPVGPLAITCFEIEIKLKLNTAMLPLILMNVMSTS